MAIKDYFYFFLWGMCCLEIVMVVFNKNRHNPIGYSGLLNLSG